jgi:CofD-related protein of GAK system
VGPVLLFFSGGTALRELARNLKRYTHRSVHVITPFDSGGSSARLRAAFEMPSVGDLRNRLLALAEDSLPSMAAVQRLLAHRLPSRPDACRRELQQLLTQEHTLVEVLPAGMRRSVCTHLHAFVARMPARFDLQGASVGNLVLAGAYLDAGGLDAALDQFSRLVEARGIVLPVVEAAMHIVARLENGRLLLGQHEITGKETPPIESPIAALHLSRTLADPSPAPVPAAPRVLELIARADLICYPMGSFYSSLVANLLPAGVGRAIRACPAPKVYVPNTGVDPEQLGLSVAGCVARLLATLRQDTGGSAPARELLDIVLLDSRRARYSGGVDRGRLGDLGVGVLDVPLVTEASSPWLDPELLSRALVSLGS